MTVVRRGVVLGALIVLASCAGVTGDACSTPPLGQVSVFFAGSPAKRDVGLTVAAIEKLAELDGFRYDMRDGSRLTWIAKEPIPGVEIGDTYRFVVDYVAGSPDASAVLVFDDDRLLFAALTDQKPFQHVLTEGIPGFSIAASDSTCPPRERAKCYDAIANVSLAIEHAGQKKILHQGEESRLGEFEIRVLTAQKVSYSSRCADAGLPGVSLILRRIR